MARNSPAGPPNSRGCFYLKTREEYWYSNYESREYQYSRVPFYLKTREEYWYSTRSHFYLKTREEYQYSRGLFYLKTREEYW